jgi:hypothetical protein
MRRHNWTAPTYILSPIHQKPMNLFSFFFYPLFLIALIGQTAADEAALPQGWVCWPLDYSGIVLGITTDSQVERLLGEGLIRESEGTTGGRYFVDEKRTATLHAVFYTDDVVGEVTIEEGINPEIHDEEQKNATSKWFNPAEGFGNYHALRLGSKKEDVIKNLGLPEEEIEPNGWRYQSKCCCELPVYFTLFFREDRMFKIVLSAPNG